MKMKWRAEKCKHISSFMCEIHTGNEEGGSHIHEMPLGMDCSIYQSAIVPFGTHKVAHVM